MAQNGHNIFVYYSITQLFQILTSGWTTTYHFGCMLPDYSMNPEAVRMLRYLWWTIILKLMELFETVFFLLRKKERQASFLHIYHHISTLIIIWAGVKYVGGKVLSTPSNSWCGMGQTPSTVSRWRAFIGQTHFFIVEILRNLSCISYERLSN